MLVFKAIKIDGFFCFYPTVFLLSDTIYSKIICLIKYLLRYIINFIYKIFYTNITR